MSKNKISFFLILISIILIGSSILVKDQRKIISNNEGFYEKMEIFLECLSDNVIVQNNKTDNEDVNYLVVFFLDNFICPPQAAEIDEYTVILSKMSNITFKSIGIIMEQEKHKIDVIENLLDIPLEYYNSDSIFSCFDQNDLYLTVVNKMFIIDLHSIELDYFHNIGTVIPTSYSDKQDLINSLYGAH